MGFGLQPSGRRIVFHGLPATDPITQEVDELEEVGLAQELEEEKEEEEEHCSYSNRLNFKKNSNLV